MVFSTSVRVRLWDSQKRCLRIPTGRRHAETLPEPDVSHGHHRAPPTADTHAPAVEKAVLASAVEPSARAQ